MVLAFTWSNVSIVIYVISLALSVTSLVFSILTIRQAKRLRTENERLRALLAEASRLIAEEPPQVMIRIPSSTLN